MDTGALNLLRSEELFISGFPADQIGVVRNLALTNQNPMSLLVIGYKNCATNFFTNDDSHCYPQVLKGNQCVCSEDYLPKVERAWSKDKSVLLCFTHMGYENAADELTAAEIEFMVNFGIKNKHDVYALLITADAEIGIKYSVDANEFFRLPTTVI
jgi:hypothetical protein